MVADDPRLGEEARLDVQGHRLGHHVGTVLGTEAAGNDGGRHATRRPFRRHERRHESVPIERPNAVANDGRQRNGRARNSTTLPLRFLRVLVTLREKAECRRWVGATLQQRFDSRRLH